MAKFLFKLMPKREELFLHATTYYPEIAPLDLYLHMWVRMLGGIIEDRVEEFLGANGITSGRFMTMMLLEMHSEGMKPSTVSGHLGITQATVTGLIDGLEQMGYAKRREHAVDGRACVVALTEKGQKFITKVRPEFNRMVAGLYTCFDETEKNQFIRLLEKLADSQKAARL